MLSGVVRVVQLVGGRLGGTWEYAVFLLADIEQDRRHTAPVFWEYTSKVQCLLWAAAGHSLVC